MKQTVGKKKKNTWKTVVVSAAAIALCSTVFTGANNVVMAMALDKEESISTTYNVSNTFIDKAEDYVKADYQVLENKVMRSINSGALPVDQAAEIGAQYLWNMFKVDLSGKTIYMSFFIDPDVAKAYWKGDIVEPDRDISDATPTYSFVVEAISGAGVSASKKYEKKETTVPFDPEKLREEYRNNCDEYLELAKQFSEKHSGVKATMAEFKDISATIDGSSVDHKNSGNYSRAYEVFVQVIVTDEQGQKTEVTISTDSKTLQSINTIDPNRKNNEKYLG